jgi:hypothetical protein
MPTMPNVVRSGSGGATACTRRTSQMVLVANKVAIAIAKETLVRMFRVFMIFSFGLLVSRYFRRALPHGRAIAPLSVSLDFLASRPTNARIFGKRAHHNEKM